MARGACSCRPHEQDEGMRMPGERDGRMRICGERYRELYYGAFTRVHISRRRGPRYRGRRHYGAFARERVWGWRE